MNKFLLFFIFFSLLFSQSPITVNNKDDLVQYNYDCPESQKITVTDDEFSILYEFAETFINSLKDMEEKFKISREEAYLSVERNSKNLLSIIEKYDYLKKTSTRINPFNDKVYHQSRIRQVDALVTLYFQFSSMYYIKDEPRRITEFDRKIIQLAEETFFTLEEEDSIYLFNNINNTNTFNFEILLSISSPLVDFYQDTKFDYTNGADIDNDKAYYWNKKKFEIYQKIYSHPKKDFLIRHLGQLEKPCMPSDAIYNTIIGSSTNDEIERFYPIGQFELDYLEFIKEFYRYDYNHKILYMEPIIKSFYTTVEDLEILSDKYEIFLEKSLYPTGFNIYRAAKSTTEQFYQLYLLNLEMLHTYGNYAFLKGLNLQSAVFDHHLMNNFINDIFQKIDEKILFKLAEDEDIQYGLHYIEYKLEFLGDNMRENMSVDSVVETSLIRLYAKKVDILEKRGREHIESGKIASWNDKYHKRDIESVRVELRKFQGHGSVLQQIQKLFLKSISGKYKNQNNIERDLKKLGSRFDFENATDYEKFGFIGMMGGLSDSGDRWIVDALLEGLGETRKSLSIEMKNFINQSMTTDYLGISKQDIVLSFVELFQIYFYTLKNLLGEESRFFLSEFIEKSDDIFRNITVKGVQENLLIFNSLSSHAKEILIINRHMVMSDLDPDKIAPMNFIHDLQYFYLIDRLRDLPVTKNSNQTLDQYLFGTSVKGVFFGKSVDKNADLLDRSMNLWREIYDKMKPNEALILYDSTLSHEATLNSSPDLKISVFKKNNENSLTYNIFQNNYGTLEDKQEVINSVKLFVKTYEKNINTNTTTLSKKVYDNLIGNNSVLEEYINDVKYITIIPDPVYTNNVPYEVLRPHSSTAFADQLLLYKFDAINYTSSISDYINTKSKVFNVALNTKAAIFGNVDYSNNKIEDARYGSLGNLEWTEDELNYISNIFWRSKIFKDKDATETNFKFNIDNNVNIIHLALHGLNIEEDYKQSALVFLSDSSNDGLLQFDEIANLNLKNINLIVLSACDTNKGESYAGFGHLSLQKAFKLSGVGNIISTLWSIDDKASYYFMVEYYNSLKKHQNSAIALTFAKRNFIEKYPNYSNPHYWAPFVHYGSY